MKKIFIGFLALITANSAFAQDAADKKFQAGITFGSGMNFQSMQTKNVKNDGVSANFQVGGTLIYMFNETIGISSGMEFVFSGAKFVPGNASLYYYYNDSKILSQKDISEATHKYSLESRKQNMTYLSIPTMVIFRTDFIGYMRYFGKLGMRHDFLLGQNSNDIGKSTNLSTNTPFVEQENRHMKGKNEVLFYNGLVGISGGAEWNFIGSTSLVAEIGFYYGVTPLFYSRKHPYLAAVDNTNGVPEERFISNAARQSQLQFKLSFLF